MRVFPLTAALAAAALLVPVASRAQSLTEAAAKEKERRKALSSSKTLTEDDLRRAGAARQREGATTDSTAAAGTADGATTAADAKGKDGAATSKAKTADEIRADQEKAWRDKLTKANDDVAKLGAQVDTLQRALNDQSQNLYGPGRAAQVSRMEDTRKQLAAAQQSVSELQEEGRRSGFRQ